MLGYEKAHSGISNIGFKGTSSHTGLAKMKGEQAAVMFNG